MKDIKWALYDVFGYMFPGAVFLAAMFLLYWTFFLEPDQDLTPISGEGWTFILLAAYVGGHLVQSLATSFMKTSYDPLLLSTERKGPKPQGEGSKVAVKKEPPETPHVPDEVVTAARTKAAKWAGIGPIAQPGAGRLLFDICDNFVQQNGKTDSREIYVYREGFYRGMTVALVLFIVALIVRVLGNDDTSIKTFGIQHTFHDAELITLAITSVLFAVLLFVRYRRFGLYLVKNAVYAALVLKAENHGAQGGAPADAGGL